MIWPPALHLDSSAAVADRPSPVDASFSDYGAQQRLLMLMAVEQLAMSVCSARASGTQCLPSVLPGKILRSFQLLTAKSYLKTFWHIA